MRINTAVILVLAFLMSSILYIGCSQQKVNKEAEPVVQKLSATHQGSWMRIKTVETWNKGDNGAAAPETSATTFTDTVEILVVADSAMTTYHKFSSECYSVYKQQYSFSGDTLLAARASDNPADSAYARSTTITLAGNQLVEVSRQSFGEGAGKSGWQQFSNYYGRFDGAVPPASWPKAVCTQGTDSNAK